MSTSGCPKHQVQDVPEDPCPYCVVEAIRGLASRPRRGGSSQDAKEALERIYQSCKQLLTLRSFVIKGKK